MARRTSSALEQFNSRLISCTSCPRLATYVQSFANKEGYWARPVPGFGDARASLVILGLAPGAHGANRTGRPFTGDAAGQFLYQGLFELGLASAPESESRKDQLRLKATYITNALRCVPPQNRPTGEETRSCAPWLSEELGILSRTKAILALGKIAHDAFLRYARDEGLAPDLKMNQFKFAHGASHQLGHGLPQLFDSFHTSRYNVNTGKLTFPMFKRVLSAAHKHSTN